MTTEGRNKLPGDGNYRADEMWWRDGEDSGSWCWWQNKNTPAGATSAMEQNKLIHFYPQPLSSFPRRLNVSSIMHSLAQAAGAGEKKIPSMGQASLPPRPGPIESIMKTELNNAKTFPLITRKPLMLPTSLTFSDAKCRAKFSLCKSRLLHNSADWAFRGSKQLAAGDLPWRTCQDCSWRAWKVLFLLPGDGIFPWTATGTSAYVALLRLCSSTKMSSSTIPPRLASSWTLQSLDR